MATASETIAQFGASLRIDAIPRPIIDKVKNHLLDTVGVACSGLADPRAQAITGLVEGWGGYPAACVLGRRMRLPAHKAAFLNALYARIHVFDDTHDAGPAHPGAAVVAAALCAAEVGQVSGSTLLTALVAGYEVATRVAAALGPTHYAAGFHNTGTCSPFGAAAAAAHALGLDAAATGAALGLAGEAAMGLRQYQQDGSMLDTALNGARGAELGVASVEMAAAGLSGPRGVLDGEWGIVRIMSGRSIGKLTDRLGADWEFEGTALKPFASSRFTHGPASVLKRAGLEARSVQSVEITTFRQSISVSDRPSPGSVREALLSHQIVAAMALLGKAIVPRDFDPLDDEVRSLSERVHVRHDPLLDKEPPDRWPHNIVVTLVDGSRVALSSDRPPHAAPELIRAKFRSLALPVLGAEQVERFIDGIARLETMPDLGELLALLHRDVG